MPFPTAVENWADRENESLYVMLFNLPKPVSVRLEVSCGKRLCGPKVELFGEYLRSFSRDQQSHSWASKQETDIRQVCSNLTAGAGESMDIRLLESRICP